MREKSRLSGMFGHSWESNDWNFTRALHLQNFPNSYGTSPTTSLDSLGFLWRVIEPYFRPQNASHDDWTSRLLSCPCLSKRLQFDVVQGLPKHALTHHTRSSVVFFLVYLGSCLALLVKVSFIMRVAVILLATISFFFNSCSPEDIHRA